MSIIRPDKRCLVLPTRRGVVLGLTASCLSAPAIVRASSIMPVRRVLITEPDRPQEGFARRLWFDACASGLVAGRITMTINGRTPSLSEAERTVRYALKYGFLSPRRAEEIRLLLADG